VHGVARISPHIDELPEGALAANATYPGVTTARRGVRGKGYTGPQPIPGHSQHTYAFQLFALDSRSDLLANSSPAALVHAIAGHVIGRARLTGTYELP
jgi:phosphatidylethanolamine-binding protein (PEBP) family uncharacterized protein